MRASIDGEDTMFSVYFEEGIRVCEVVDLVSNSKICCLKEKLRELDLSLSPNLDTCPLINVLRDSDFVKSWYSSLIIKEQVCLSGKVRLSFRIVALLELQGLFQIFKIVQNGRAGRDLLVKLRGKDLN